MSKNGDITRIPMISGSCYADELHLLLKNEVMIRRLKVNVVDQLPPLRLESLSYRPSFLESCRRFRMIVEPWGADGAGCAHKCLVPGRAYCACCTVVVTT